jgi:transcriptional regulator with GAF, ATPase, and Fis domain
MENVLVALIEGLSRAHTESTFTQAAFDVLARHLPIASLELTLSGPAGSEKQFAAAASAQQAASRSRGPERTIPLTNDASHVGRATLVFVHNATPPAPTVVEDIGRVLSAALRQLRALARVAKVSRRAHAQTRELGDRLRELLPSSIVAASPSMQRIFGDVIPAVARQPITVLLLGETGTGKEVVARRIHEVSPRARRVYLRINCGAIPPTLLESALFGHERGAFTGALRAQAGVFERAHEGTLLLDEVGELSLDAQVRLLRVLETGEFERVGGGRTQRIDVRVIAATHRDLDAMTADGRFRRDLFYRLSVFPVRIPPLRERLDDIEPLARHILDSLSRSFDEPTPALDRKTIQRLRAYSWPGNVRELENVLARSLVLSRSGPLQVDLPSAPRVRAPMRFEEASRRCIADALRQVEGGSTAQRAPRRSWASNRRLS